MKKLLFIFLTVLFITSCNKTEKNNTEITTQEETPIEVSSWITSDNTPEKQVYNLDEIISSRDIKNCDKIENTLDKISCTNSIYLLLAQENKDYSYCDKIRWTQYKENCITSVNNIHLKDGQCDNIKNSSDKNICTLEKNIEESKNIKLSDCNNIQDKEIQNKCSNYYYITYVQNTPDIKENSYCEKITNEYDKANCNEIIKERNWAQNEQKQVQNIISNSQWKDKKMIEIEQNCSKLPWGISSFEKCREEKYSVLAVEAKDVSLCNNLSNASAQNNCKNYYVGLTDLEIFQKARDTKNINLCNDIQDSLSKEQCKTLVGKK